MNTPTPIRTDVTPSMHPDYLLPQAKVLDIDGTLGQSAIGLAREALTTLYTTLGDLSDAERKVRAANPPPASRGKPNFTQPPLPQAFLDAASASFDRAAATLDARMKTLFKQRDALAERVATALRVPETSANLANAQEVRNYLRSVSPTERTKVIREAIANKDAATVSAAFGAQAFLSGLDPKLAAQLRTEAATAFAPVDHAQLGALDKTIDIVKQASLNFVTAYTRIRDGGDKQEKATKSAIADLAAGGKK
jgi:hypothetical protein